MAGRALVTGQPVTSARDCGCRWWSRRPGPGAHGHRPGGQRGDPGAGRAAGRVRRAGRHGDRTGHGIPYVRRRGRALSLPAGMRWDLLLPLSARAAGALIAGVLEPACDIAGDAFGYAVNGAGLHFAIFGGLGHGIGSTLLTGLAVGAYRHARGDGGRGGRRARGCRSGAGRVIRWRLVRHRHRRPFGHRAGAGGVLLCWAPAAAVAAWPQGWSPSSTAMRRCRSGSAVTPAGRAAASWSRMTRCCCTPAGWSRRGLRTGSCPGWSGRPACWSGGCQRPAGRGTAAPAGPGRAGAPGWRPAR
jgi:hypothetical protein